MKAGSVETHYRRPCNGGECLPLNLRRQALGRGFAVIVLADCADDWIKQAVANEAKRQIEKGQDR